MIGAALAAAVALAGPAHDPAATRAYHAFVCAESEDVVHLVRFGPGGLEKLRDVPVGSFPTEIEGPHGVAVSPDGRHLFVSLAHGRPFGSVHKYAAGTGEWLGDVKVGMFPATMAVSAATGLLYVVNFDLYGPMEPSTISVVETSTMIEVDRVGTGIMPHGARLDASGATLYSVSMMSDELVEVDALRFEVRRRLALGSGAAPAEDGAMSMAVQPTWATAPTPQGRVYVTGNADGTIYEVDLGDWRVTRRLSGGAGPYNADATPDGERLAVTYKREGAVGFWDLTTGTETARVATTRSVAHGVVVTPDGRFALVTAEGIGGEPGSVEVYDVALGARVAQLDVGKQAGGIALWEPALWEPGR